MARIALYRKYRPKDFTGVSGQEHIMKVLKNTSKTSFFSHAYIFCGPRGIGKTSVARIMAKAVNCEKPSDGNPCNKCASCVSINNQTALDVIEIDAASNRGIDEIRDLREKVKFSPSELKYKVFIIDEVHMLTREAFNALLKTLEEPPAHALFIMATTEIHKIPATVISRCQRFDFKKIGMKELEEGLSEIAKKEKLKITKEAISVIAQASEGGFRDAISILDQLSMNTGSNEITEAHAAELLGIIDSTNLLKLVKEIEADKKKETLDLLSDLLKKGADIGQLTKGLMVLYRKKVKDNITDSEKLDSYIYAIETLAECNKNFKYALYSQLSLEVAILKIMDFKRRASVSVEIEKGASQRSFGTEKDINVGKVSKITLNIDEITRKDSGEKDIDSSKSLDNWNQVLFEIKSKNNSIHAILRDSEPALVGDEIHLVFPYKFHKERIEDRKNKKIVDEAVSKVCGKGYSVICKLGKKVMREENEPKKESDIGKEKADKETSSISDFLDVLGGELVAD